MGGEDHPGIVPSQPHKTVLSGQTETTLCSKKDLQLHSAFSRLLRALMTLLIDTYQHNATQVSLQHKKQSKFLIPHLTAPLLLFLFSSSERSLSSHCFPPGSYQAPQNLAQISQTHACWTLLHWHPAKEPQWCFFRIAQWFSDEKTKVRSSETVCRCWQSCRINK